METVVLAVHPAVEEATRDGAAWEDNAALAALAQQAGFLNELQAGVNQWTAALRRATHTPRLETMPAGGTAAEETRFWEEAEAVLGAAETRLASAACQVRGGRRCPVLRRWLTSGRRRSSRCCGGPSAFTRRSRWTRSWRRCGQRWSGRAATVL